MIPASRSLKNSGGGPVKPAKMIRLSRAPKTGQVNYWQFMEEFPMACQSKYPSIFKEAFEDQVGTNAERVQALYTGLEEVPLLSESVPSCDALHHPITINSLVQLKYILFTYSYSSYIC